MLQPDTASAGESIWNKVQRAEFEKNVAGLIRENELSATNQIYPLPSEDDHFSSTLLPLDIERELADDFAFIAAYEEGVNTVTAVAIEVSSNFLRIVLAANEGIRAQVESAIRYLLSMLEDCARRSMVTPHLQVRVQLIEVQSYPASCARFKLSTLSCASIATEFTVVLDLGSTRNHVIVMDLLHDR